MRRAAKAVGKGLPRQEFLSGPSTGAVSYLCFLGHECSGQKNGQHEYAFDHFVASVLCIPGW
jgi:hypothetical protein